MEGGAPTNAGPINTATTGKGAIMGFDPVLKFSRRATKKRKKQESASKQWEHRRNDPTYIDGRSKHARKLIKRLAKRKKKMAEETVLEDLNSNSNSSGGGGEGTKQAYKFISQKRKVQKKQEREKRASNRKKEIEMISRAKASDYAKKGKERQKKLATQLKNKNEELEVTDLKHFGDGIIYLESLCELADEGKVTTFFFADDTELELTQEQASVIVDRFNQLSEEHKEKLLDMLPESKEIFTTFMTM
jgi:hypothetical protein